MRHLGEDVFGHPSGLLQRPLLVATGTETSHPARKRDEELLTALGAADAGEAVLEVATLEELPHHGPDDGPPEAIALLVTLVVLRLELRKEAFNQLIECRLLRLPGTIDAAGLLGPTGHDQPPYGGRLRPTHPRGQHRCVPRRAHQQSGPLVDCGAMRALWRPFSHG